MYALQKLGIIFLLSYNITFGYDNFALRKSAWQSSTYDQTYFADAAVNGDRSQTFGSRSCAVAEPRMSNSWRVDLGTVCSIHHITIYYRFESQFGWKTYYQGRFAGFFLYVSNTTNKDEGHLCMHNTERPTPQMTIECLTRGRYVIFYNERQSGVTYPDYYSSEIFNELCEVEVYGCPPGLYGGNCSSVCPENCNTYYCDIVNGTCDSCVDGYEGKMCNQPCEDFYYGHECGLVCGNCLQGVKCNITDGTCPNGCSAGWKGHICHDVCDPRTYGLECNQSCSTNCISNTSRICDYVTGKCDSGCIPGWKGDRCDKKCNGKKYGQSCHRTCGVCLNFTQCHHIDGTCASGCDRGYHGDSCSESCRQMYYGENCQFNCSSDCNNRTCDAITGACISLPITGKQLNYVAVIAGGTGGVIGICGLIIAFVIKFRRRKPKPENPYEDYHFKDTDMDIVYTSTTSSNPSFNIYEELPESPPVGRIKSVGKKKT